MNREWCRLAHEASEFRRRFEAGLSAAIQSISFDRSNEVRAMLGLPMRNRHDVVSAEGDA